MVQYLLEYVKFGFRFDHSNLRHQDDCGDIVLLQLKQRGPSTTNYLYFTNITQARVHHPDYG